MLITTIMTFFVVRYGWKYPWSLVHRARPASSSSSTSRFFAANLVKIFDGGWFPLLIGGADVHADDDLEAGPQADVASGMREEAIDLHSFLESVFVSPPTRVAGTAVFLVVDQGLTPNALLHNLKHNKVLHERNLFVTVRHHEVPWIAEAERCDDRAARQRLLAGDAALRLQERARRAGGARAAARRAAASVEDMDTSYFLSRDIVIPTLGGGMADWREKLFAGMHRNAAAAADFLRLPANRVVELGAKVEI